MRSTCDSAVIGSVFLRAREAMIAWACKHNELRYERPQAFVKPTCYELRRRQNSPAASSQDAFNAPLTVSQYLPVVS